jgi:hypothetical protein
MQDGSGGSSSGASSGGTALDGSMSEAAADGPDGDVVTGEVGTGDGPSSLEQFCTVAIAAGCGGHPATVMECVSLLASMEATCTQVDACIACSGGSPSVVCSDAGKGPQITSCAACSFDQCGGPPKDGGGDGDATIPNAALQQFCTAVIAAGCGGHPGTVTECVTLLASMEGTCAQVDQCIACSGATPTVLCSDAGKGPKVTSCAACSFDQCGGPPKDGGGDGSPGCPGTQMFSGAGLGSSPTNPTPIPSGGLAKAVTIFGPALQGGGGFAEFGGFIEVTGLAPGAAVAVNVIMYPCSNNGCPNDISFEFGAFDGGSPQVIQSSGSTCGSGLVTADGNGNLFISVSKNGDSGAENNYGLYLSLPVPVDAGALDASDGGG